MQYLIRVALEGTSLWRLDAVDGKADLAHIAALICASFGYKAGHDEFLLADNTYTAGHGGEVLNPSELVSFESLIKDAPSFIFTHTLDNGAKLKHNVQVMRCEEKLFCLLPSVIVGSGCVDFDGDYSLDAMQEYADRDENLTLDIKNATSAMRAIGSVRADVNGAIVSSGAPNLNFKSI